MKYLIVGTPRSGTTFMSKLFTSAGWPTNHEAWFGNPGYGTWLRDATGEASWMALPFTEEVKRRNKDARIVHIIRNPLKVISSLMHSNFLTYKAFQRNAYTMYLKSQLPEIVAYEDLDRYIFFWMRWNQECRKRADLTYRIEDINKDLGKIFKDLKMEVKEDVEFHSDKKTNGYKGVKQMKLKDFEECVFYDEFIKVAKEFGYELE